MSKKNLVLCLISFSLLVLAACTNNVVNENLTADDDIVSVKSYGFVDLEGAKTKAIIVEYKEAIEASSVTTDSYSITDYTLLQEKESGFDDAIEIDYDDVKGNEGQITKVYVNDKPETSDSGKNSGKYVIIEVNTEYMLAGQNLKYTDSMIAGATQILPIKTSDGRNIDINTKEMCNYTVTEPTISTNSNSTGKGKNGGKGGNGGNGQWTKKTERTADKTKIILPEFAEGTGWTLHYVDKNAFKATNCYSEYTGKYCDFELPYSLYVPDKKVLDANKGNVSLVMHMEHAGAGDTDPMSAITSSRAAVKLSSSEVQEAHPTIVVVPQVEESRRSTDDLVASSEVNTAAWELMDSLLKEYKDYINIDHIYGTGQSMGGMTILNMASQRDNFFAGIAVVGAQWSNNYNKDFEHSGSPARTPENDPISFSGENVDKENYANFYYMVSDDNILIQTCTGDTMCEGEWTYLKDYMENAGGNIAYAEWDPYLKVSEQDELGIKLLNHDTVAAGTGISWAGFTRGSHMSTWKYGYRLTYPFEWLFNQTRETELNRDKLTNLLNTFKGRDASGKLLKDSGTTKLNSAQFDTSGESSIYTENWTPVSALNTMIDNLSKDSDTYEDDVKEINTLYDLLTEDEKSQVKKLS